ncbi:MAG: hypothetical protein ACKOB9_02645 [Solirubrobacterales bacterium]
MATPNRKLRPILCGLLLAACVAPASAGAQVTSLDWKSCSQPQFDRWKKIDGASLEGFDCAPFTRPLNRRKPAGSKVTLAVVRLPATGTAAERKGTLFLNPGGPGQSGVGLSDIAFLLPAEVRRSFDFVT